MKKYSWKPGVTTGIKASDFGETVERIRRERETVTPKDIVDEARSRSSVLHRYFTWDDHKAAEAYRESQAQYLLRGIEIRIISNHKMIITRAFVSIRDEHRYEPIRSVLEVPAWREGLLNGALAELQSFKRKYATLKELAGLFKAIDIVLKKKRGRNVRAA